ncbi:MAG: diguanylate cyclase [Hyphomonas sp.]
MLSFQFMPCARRALTLLAMGVALAASAHAQAISLDSIDGRVNIGSHVAYAQGVDPEATLADIMAPDSSVEFRQSGDPVFHGARKGGDVWLKTELVNSSDTEAHNNLVVRYPYVQSMEAFLVSADGRVSRGQAGGGVDISGIGVPAPFPAFALNVPPHETNTLYLRVHSDTVLILPLWLHTNADYELWSHGSIAIYMLLIGIMCSFTFYAFSLARHSRETAYGLYFCFCAASALYVLFSSGVAKTLFWSGTDFSTLPLVYALQGVLTASGALFIAAFLDIRARWPVLSNIIRIVAALSLLCSFNAFLPEKFARLAYIASSGVGPLVILVGVWALYNRKVQGAGAILLAWSPSILATVWLYLRIFDLTPYLEINHYIVPLGLSLTLLQFSWAVGKRVREAETGAMTDPLTGLPNRRHLDATLQQIGKGFGLPCTGVLALDLDGFKGINDTHGHAAGDLVLEIVAERLKQISHGFARPYRTGGDEFIILYTKPGSRTEMRAFAERCIEHVSKPIKVLSCDMNVGASIGIAFVDTPVDIQGIVPRADEALYMAKRSGKGTVCLYDQRPQESQAAHEATALNIVAMPIAS